MYTDAGLKNELPSTTKPDTLSGQTLYVGPMVGTQGVQYTAVATPACHFVNVENSKGGSKKGTLLLENPRGNTFNVDQLLAQVMVLFYYCKPTFINDNIISLTTVDYLSRGD